MLNKEIKGLGYILTFKEGDLDTWTQEDKEFVEKAARLALREISTKLAQKRYA